jgi:hypothetical protein
MNSLIARLRNSAVYQAPNETGATPAPVESTPPAGDTKPAGDQSLLSVAGADEKVGGEEKDGTPPPAEPFTALLPDALKFPEGVEVIPETVTSFLEIMNDQTLSRADLAQKLVDLQLSESGKANEAAMTAAQSLWTETQDQWRAEAKALPELGGANLDKTLSAIKKGLDTIGADKAFFDAMDLTGAGNHPAVIRVLYAATKHLQEGAPIGGTPPKGPISKADVLFGGTKE